MKLTDKEINSYVALVVIVLFSAILTIGLVYFINNYEEGNTYEK